MFDNAFAGKFWWLWARLVTWSDLPRWDHAWRSPVHTRQCLPATVDIKSCSGTNVKKKLNPSDESQRNLRINPKSKRDKWSIRGSKCYGIAYALGMSCEPSNIFFCSSIPVGSIMWMDAWRHRILVQSSPFHSEHIRSQNSPPFRKGWCRKQKTQILQWWSSSLLAF